MSDPLVRLRRFLRELKRRKVYRVAVAYLVAAFVTVQLGGLAAGAFELPGWFEPMVWAVCGLGFPLALVLAWAFEVTPEGVQRTSARDRSEGGSASADVGPAQSRLALQALVGLGLVAAAVAGGWYLMGGGGRSPEIREKTVAVLPFQVSGSGAETWRDGMVTYLTPGLDGAGGLRAIPDRTVFAAWEERRRPGNGASVEEALSVARGIGAQYAVIGSAGGLGSEVRFAVQVYGTETGERLGQVEVRGSPESVPSLADSLIRRLLEVLLEEGGKGMPSVDLGRVTTRSLPALKAYLEGEQEFRAGHYEEALAALREAVEADTAFALAYNQMSVTAQWLGTRPELERRAAEQALRHADHLSDRDRRLLEATLAASRGEAGEAERLYRGIVATYPNDIEAWYQLGEVLFHHGPMRARSITRSSEAWKRVLAVEPDHLPSLVHVGLIAAVADRPAELDSIVRRELEIAPGEDDAVVGQALLAYEVGDTAAQLRLQSELGDVNEIVLNRSVYTVGAFVEDLEGAARLAELMTAESRAPWTRLSGYLILAHLELGRGRWRAAERALEASDKLNPILALHYRALLSLAPFLDRSEGELAALRDSVAAASSPGPAEAPSTAVRSGSRTGPGMQDLVTALEPHRRSYLLGLLSAQLGEHETALRHASDLEAAEAPADAGSLVNDMALAVRAQVALDRERWERALGYLERVRGEANYSLIVNSGFFVEARERFVRAEVLQRLGREDEALRWFGSFAEHSLYALPYVAPSHLQRAEILERRGDTEAALRHYRRFVELWRDADPELQPRVERARQRLQKLAAGTAVDD